MNFLQFKKYHNIIKQLKKYAMLAQLVDNSDAPDERDENF